MMADTTEPEVTELRLIPPPVECLTRKAALRWLTEDAGDWVRVLGVGFARAASSDARDSFDMLSIDVAQLVEACTRVIATGKAERLSSDECSIERPSIRLELANIVASRPSDSTEAPGSCESMFAALAQRLVELLAGREAA